MALGDRIYEDATEIYFHRRQINTARFGWALPLSFWAPLSSAKPRPLWRLGWSADQCVEVKIPVFFLRTGKPSSANVASVV